ncbi:hypothetical protein LSH36_799g00015 [Paralvinella palmiformis]|uniref:WD repeat-containing protein 11 n=1 Tax=Paralvinella palmiformis TaxID=53620 RepID=A0AAD9J0S8_9ANNE|nr:hypothetical protein LSH36_799g00015 [Paralvinella palmiformis]
MMCCPVSEFRVALILSDSRLLIWELKTIDYQDSSLVSQSPLFTPGAPVVEQPMAGDGVPSAVTSLLPNPNLSVPKLSMDGIIGHSQSFLTEHQTNLAHRHGVLLKFVLTRLLNGVAAPPLIIRMCPPLTTKNWAVYEPLLAVGTSSGVIQVYNISSGLLVKELSIHMTSVRGIEWVSLHSFLSYAYPTPGQSGVVKNELLLTDIQTGKSVGYRSNRDEESPIEMLRVSYLKQYFVVLFKNKPFELWDLRSGTLLRQMPKNFPHVTALEWSPAHFSKSLKKKSGQGHETTSSQPQSQVELTSSGSAVMDPVSRSEPRQAGGSSSSVREHFVFTDNNGLLYHFILEGNMLKDGSKIPPDGSMGSITSIAWKAETLVLADVDGNLNLWDLKARLSRAVATHRGWIRKIRFAPGRGNMKLLVLFADGADIWDTKDVERISSVKCPKDMSKISDVDWAASDRPVLVSVDGIIRITDLKFSQGSSPLEDGQLTEPFFCPHLLAPKVALTLKCLLQHQPWNKEYRLHLEETDENADVAKAVNDQLELIDRTGSTVKPRTGSTVKPRTGSTVKPRAGSTVKPRAGSTVKPRAGSTVKPRAGSTVKPEQDQLLNPEQDQLLNPEQDQLLNPEQDQLLNLEQDQLLNLEQDQLLNLAGSTVKPRTGSTVKPRTGSTVKPRTGSTVKPRTGSTVKPRTGSTRIPRSSSSLSSGDLFFPSTPGKESHDLLLLDESQGHSDQDKAINWSFLKDKPLEICHDLLCDNDTFQKYQLERINIHDSKRATYDHTKKCVENLIYLGQTDRAVQLLLETESENEHYYADCIKACLVASIRSSGASQSTIKLVATNLIASGQLTEGVQLLILIDKGLDACRYLQDHGHWDQASWLAKSMLDYSECSEILKRWSDHLCSPQVNLKSVAVLVLLSLGQFSKVLRLLYNMRHFDRAALFAEACDEFGLLDNNQEMKSLKELIFLEYGRYLLHLGNHKACDHYCHLAGDKGKQLMADVNSAVYSN